MVECEECGMEAEWMIEQRIHITNIKTNALMIHPSDSYEHNLMTDYYCSECAMKRGYLDEMIQ